MNLMQSLVIICLLATVTIASSFAEDNTAPRGVTEYARRLVTDESLQSGTLGAPSGCPFQRSGSPDETIASVKAALQSLAGQEDACGQAISQNAFNLNSLLDEVVSDAFPVTDIRLDGTTSLSCENYQQILDKEHSIALENMDNTFFQLGVDFLPRYRGCSIFRQPESEINLSELESEYSGLATQADRLRYCINDVHAETLYRMIEQCELQDELRTENTRNIAYRERVVQLATLAQDLIKSSEDCTNKDIIRNVSQSVISLATTFGTFALGGGIAGAGVALGGGLLSALVDRFFSSSGPNEYLQQLETEEQWEQMNCLYYQVQSNNLACGASSSRRSPPARVGNDCVDLRQSEYLKGIQALSDAVSEVREAENGAVAAAAADRIRDALDREIPDPSNPEGSLKVSEYLARMRDSLQENSTASRDLILSGQIGKILQAADSYDVAAATRPIDVEAVNTANTELLNSVKGNGTSGTPFDLNRAISQYWSTEREKGNVSHIERLMILEAAEIDQARLTVPEVASDQSQKIAHNALVSLYQQKFNNRLEDLNTRYLSNAKPRGDRDFNDNLDYLIPIFKQCALNAGMYHYEEDHRGENALNRVGDASSEYEEVCKKFQCPDGSLLKPFALDENSPDTPGTQFKGFQCGMTASYNKNLRLFAERYQQTGEICPTATRPPDPAGDAPEGGGGDRPGFEAQGVGRGASGHVRDGFSPPPVQEEAGGGFFDMIGDVFSSIWDFITGLF